MIARKFGMLVRCCAKRRHGGVANVGVASYAVTSSRAWWLAGLAGVGSVRNFAMSSVFTWRRR
jgi:hypothetical protein